jgi:WhiB family redox-sensing transcriptional regulator
VNPAPDWYAGAACSDEDPEIWFPLAVEHGRTLGSHPDAVAAVGICHTCPVEAQCLDWARQTGQAHGIWGGLTPAERRELQHTGGTRRCRASAGVRS